MPAPQEPTTDVLSLCQCPVHEVDKTVPPCANKVTHKVTKGDDIRLACEACVDEFDASWNVEPLLPKTQEAL